MPSLSGCCFAIRRELWVSLGGYAAEYFAYHEDTELSLRLWQRGLSAEYLPDAVVRHHYEFSRNELKYYLIERNRLITVLTTYQMRSLIVLAPVLALTEAAMLAAALAGGWVRPKARGWAWLWRHRDDPALPAAARWAVAAHLPPTWPIDEMPADQPRDRMVAKQVFGREGEWALIQYRVRGAKLRFGYVNKKAIEDFDALPELRFEAVSFSGENDFVTSDPLGDCDGIELPGQTWEMTRLATLGDVWFYVEITLPTGETARMFAEKEASHG